MKEDKFTFGVWKSIAGKHKMAYLKKLGSISRKMD